MLTHVRMKLNSQGHITHLRARSLSFSASMLSRRSLSLSTCPAWCKCIDGCDIWHSVLHYFKFVQPLDHFHQTSTVLYRHLAASHRRQVRTQRAIWDCSYNFSEKYGIACNIFRVFAVSYALKCDIARLVVSTLCNVRVNVFRQEYTVGALNW